MNRPFIPARSARAIWAEWKGLIEEVSSIIIAHDKQQIPLV